jgi:hypothetical protein
MRLIFIIISGVLLFFIQCTSERDTSQSYLHGTWDAEWYLVDEDMQQMFSATEITMYGHVVFDQDEKAEITAFGFEGCVFASDTAMNQLNYHFQDSILNLTNGEKDIIFTYKVKEKMPDKLTLELMNDIQLTLRR